MTAAVARECGSHGGGAADLRILFVAEIEEVEAQGIETYVPDPVAGSGTGRPAMGDAE